jgi:hypothetical protein
VVNKVGRTAGWTRGPTTGTCVDVLALGTNHIRLCQAVVTALVDAGDSGSSVFFRRGNQSNVTLLGIPLGGQRGRGESGVRLQPDVGYRTRAGGSENVLKAGPLRFEIDLPPQVRVGAPVPITLRATNTGAKPLDLYLRGREIAFDITVISEKGGIVWRRLEGRTVPAILQLRTLGPGESLELSDLWDQQTTRECRRARDSILSRGRFLRTQDNRGRRLP